MGSLPQSLAPRDDRESIYEDIEPYVGTSPSDRDEILQKLCALAAEQIAAHPRAKELRQYQDPRTRESEALWLRLVAQSRS